MQVKQGIGISVAALVVIGLLFLLISSLSSCNTVARRFGGTITEEVKPGRKVVMASWKNNDLWVLTRPMRTEEAAEILEYKETSTYGIVEGTVIIKESK